MAVKKVEKIWMNGKLINWDDAKIHVLSHVIHYGSSFFEGIRCYKTGQGPAVFRLGDHVKRLIYSARIFRAEIPFTYEQIFDAIIDTIKTNEDVGRYTALPILASIPQLQSARRPADVMARQNPARS